MASVQKFKLLDGRAIRELKDSPTQVNMFTLHSSGLFVPAIESIMSVKDHDQSLQSRTYRSMCRSMCKMWWRCREYAFYNKDPKAPLGKEILWVEDGTVYKKAVPDVPVKVNGKEIPLRKAVGMGVYDSIGLLKIEQVDENSFLVSVADPGGVIGKVRAVDFMRRGWALTDETGLPIASNPISSDEPSARWGIARTDFEEKATGYHGSLVRGFDFYNGFIGRNVSADVGWSWASGVAFISGRSNFASDVL